MPKKIKIALIIFSNDLDDYLPNIETERKIIEDALEHYDDTNRLKIITRSSVSISELFRLFNRYHSRIVLFHFAGHASGKGLQFNKNVSNTETGNAEGIAELIQREVKEGILKFVFLNGCSTVAQVKRLKAIGVPSIIATHYPIDDDEAMNFARMFYRTWAKTDVPNTFEAPLTTIQQAFEISVAYLKTLYPVQVTTENKGSISKINNIKTDIAWELFTTAPETILPNNIVNEVNEQIFKTYKTVIQNADKIYNIKHIDKADFS